MECLESKCLDYKIWILYEKRLEFEILRTKMFELCEYLKLKTEN